ncbi:ATP-binding protein [Clostridium thailandense]|uniref:HAMP domain-containing sensor histidine kinase n=1 Tax=Clostridium thailandense TaxID=2794346 RepID=UPI00398A4141
MGVRKQISLRNIFVRYILYFIFGTVILILFYAFIFLFMVTNNIILPANYTEQKIESSKYMLSKVDKVTEEMIPEGCSYGVFDAKGNMIYGNFNSKASKTAWNVVQKNEKSLGMTRHYAVIQRKTETCIIEYFITAQFSNPLLKKYLGNPELLVLILFILSFIFEVGLLSIRFGRYFSKEMKLLMEATEEIKKQNLDFQPNHSGIREIEEVIYSLNSMKSELKDSLKKQWNMEKGRKNQISALAHDIKTPLTIIKGNAELVKETCEDEEQMKYNRYILSASEEIEHYLKVLIDITKSEDILAFSPIKIETKTFVEKIVEQEKALAFEKSIQLINDQENISEFFYGDEELLYRAILNVIANAVEYSPQKGKLFFKVEEDEKFLKFLIEDSGKGFSKEELEFASDQFYRGDKSRNSKNHYGIGLYITRSFTELHQGTVELSNSTKTRGAQVIIKIPKNRS